MPKAKKPRKTPARPTETEWPRLVKLARQYRRMNDNPDTPSDDLIDAGAHLVRWILND